MGDEVLTAEGVSSLTSIPSLVERVKLSFVQALRHSFSSNLTNKDIRYNQDESLTKIKIYTAYPLRMEFVPAIVVNVSSGDLSFNYLQDDFLTYIEDKEISIYNGKVPLTIRLSVISNGTLEREKIIDHLIFYLRHVFLGLFRRYNIYYLSNISLGDESIQEVSGRLIYEQAITIPCYVEYTAEVDMKEIETLQAITVQAIDTIVSNGGV